MNIEGAKAAINAFKEALNQDTVSEEVFLYRSRLCKSCPAKQKSAIAPVVSKILSRNKVPPEISGSICSVCKCPLTLLLGAKSPHVDSEKEKKRREKLNPRCWNLK